MDLGLRTSGPPGVEISIAVIVSGTLAMGLLSHRLVLARRETCPTGGVETRGEPCEVPRAARPDQEKIMDWDDLKPKTPKGITLGESLETLSVSELEARIAALHQEIERVQREVAAKKAHEAAAAAFFKQ
jgi:uncharacterized small protein (DUF1192 family)